MRIIWIQCRMSLCYLFFIILCACQSMTNKARLLSFSIPGFCCLVLLDFGKWILWWILLALIVLLNLVGQFVMIALTFPQNGCHQPSPFTGNVTLDWIHRQKLKWFWNLKNKFLKNHTNVDFFFRYTVAWMYKSSTRVNTIFLKTIWLEVM